MGITQETVNHRKLVQELYDKQVLHRVVGIKPLPTVVTANGYTDSRHHTQNTSSSSKSNASRGAVNSAWDGRDADHDSDHEDGYRDRHHIPADDEGGRYAIGRQPPKKRRKTGRSEDSHAVYFVDDEEDTDGARREDFEAGEYMSDESEVEERPSRSGVPKNDNKRSYWLSKATGIEGGLEDDSN